MNPFSIRFIFLVQIGLCTALLSSCNQSALFDENQSIGEYKWEYQDVKSFSVDIEDTSLRYDISLHLRHSSQFEWRNLWVKITTVIPDNSSKERRVNLQLSDASGEWYGECLGDNCDRKIRIQHLAKFPMKGTYIFRIAQDMRQNPLLMMKSIGLSVELSQKKD